MQKVNKLSKFRFISQGFFISLPLLLIACGGQSSSSGTAGETPTVNVGGARDYKPLPLNDTGVTYYIDAEISVVATQSDTAGTIKSSTIEYLDEPENFPGQDAKFGRDVSNPSAVGGIAGFDFVKLDKDNGSELPANSFEFGCVKDKTTNLVWENKTNPSKSTESDYYQLHNGASKHTWYNPNENTNGGDAGQQASTGSCEVDSTDIRSIASDTFNFINAVNKEGLCGFSDWRIPTAEELRSIVDYGVSNGNFVTPMADKEFFPFIATTLHRWTSQTLAHSPDRAFGFHFHDGITQSHNKYCAAGNSSNYGNGAVAVRGVF